MVKCLSECHFLVMPTPAVGVRVSVSEREASRREGIAEVFGLLSLVCNQKLEIFFRKSVF